MREKLVTVRPARIDDVDFIHRIEEACFSDAWSRDAFVSELEENPQAHYFVVEIGGEAVAYAGYWKILDQAHITNVAVLPEHRRKGIGVELIRKLLSSGDCRGIRSYTLECRVSNEAAIGLYESMGFQACGIRPKYYLDNQEDALIMWLEK